MKKYTLLEALNMLKQDHDLVFKIVPEKNPCTQTISSSVFKNVIVDCQGCQGQNGCCSLQFSDTWILEPRPVSFMEAMKAFDNGKVILCVYDNNRKIVFVPKALGTTDNELVDINRRGVAPLMILEGKWYIKEGEN